MRLIDAEGLKKEFKEAYAGITFSLIECNDLIDNAPAVEKTILKRRDVNKCLNCSCCCEASINSKGEVYITCNLGSQCSKGVKNDYT